ncbi:legume-like lectin, partial [Gaertneriomyces semiglobifer]
RHDYRFTFKKPYFMYDEKSIPYWELTKGVLASNDSIRLTPSVPDHQGSVWSIRPNPYPEWQAVFSFSAFGRGFLGGEGLAFWYTEDRMIEGPMYGNKDAWKGLAVVFDTAEQAENRYTPYIYGVYNDGKEHYANRDDYVQTALSGCFRDYRNTPTPVFARITYANETLKVEIDLRQQGSGFTECFKATPIKLPTGYYFGISAATEAHLADDHDIYLFELTQLNPPPRKKEVERPHEAEHIAKEGQFQISEEMKENIEKV